MSSLATTSRVPSRSLFSKSRGHSWTRKGWLPVSAIAAPPTQETAAGQERRGFVAFEGVR
jgi:hypothetical protein